MRGFAFAAAGLLTASVSHAAFTLNSGNATLSSATTPALVDSNLATIDFRPEGGATVDHQFYYNWSVNNGFSGNRGFSAFDTPTQVVAGNTLTLTYTNAGAGASGFARWNAVVTIVLTDGPGTGEATVDSTVVFTAAANNSANVNYVVFHGLDFDLSASAANDSTIITSSGGNANFTVTDGGSASIAGVANGVTNFEVGASSTTRNKLTGGTLSTLSGVSSLLNADAALAFQWNVNLAPGASTTFRSNYSVVVPEPATLGLAMLAAPMMLRRRRA